MKMFKDFYKGEVAEEYNSKRFTRKRSIFWDRLDKKIVFNEIKKTFNTKKKIRVLDLGCGTGRFSLFLSSLKNIELYGVDPSTDMLGICKKEFDRKHRKIILKIGDTENIPLRDDFFDVVICFRVFIHIKEYQNSLREIFRILKKDGIFIFDILNKFSLLGPITILHRRIRKIGSNTHRFSIKEVFDIAKKEGFKDPKDYPIKTFPLSGFASHLSFDFAEQLERGFKGIKNIADGFIITLKK